MDLLVGSMHRSIRRLLTPIFSMLPWMVALLLLLTGAITYLTSKLVLNLVLRLESLTSVIVHSMVYGKSLLMDSLILQHLVRLQSLKIEEMLLMIIQDCGQMKLPLAMEFPWSSLTPRGKRLVF